MARGINGYMHCETLRVGGVADGEPKGTETLTGAGAVNPDKLVTMLVTNGANALTLANGEVQGQIKIITMKTDGGDGTLTPTSLVAGASTTITFNDVGDSVVLMWNGAAWNILSNQGCTLA